MFFEHISKNQMGVIISLMEFVDFLICMEDVAACASWPVQGLFNHFCALDVWSDASESEQIVSSRPNGQALIHVWK